jgi:UDP-N-acetylglucosamine diphosphorylase/glucosamine-1-phosphate N-acetyltransferase
MRLILFDLPSPKRFHFDPLALNRPIWDLRCGFTSLADKLVAKVQARAVACFVPPHLCEAYRERSSWPVNDTASLRDDDLLLVHSRVKAADFHVPPLGPSQYAVDDAGELLFARIARHDVARLDASSWDALMSSIRETLPQAAERVSVWNYTWELVLENPEVLKLDYAASGRSGVEGTVEQPFALRGSQRDLYVAPGAVVHPMVVIDAEHGPVYIDEGAEIHPFSRIEGPCYIGKKSILFGAKCREGNSIGPMCRVGGEVEEAIIHGYSNKYHDGFLGHAYVGEWVNLGAMTTNSDLKNDYSNVGVCLDGSSTINTNSRKVGSLIGDHAKTSIGTLFNTGAYVGAMSVIMATGKPLPKFIPSFAWFLEGVVTKGFGKAKLYATARVAMDRRGCQWTAAQEAMWDAIFEQTAPIRDESIRKGRRALAGG